MKSLKIIEKLKNLFILRATEKEMIEIDEFVKDVPRKDWDIDRALYTVHSKMFGEESIVKESYVARHKEKRNTFSPAIQFARISFAVILIGIVSYLVLTQFGLFERTTSQTSSLQITTHYGNIKKIVLNDGTLVVLNAASTLDISKDYGNTDRLVKLSGEAYFEVIHNDALSFKVETKNLTITDIGTAFDVKAFPNEKNHSVSLVEGKVSVTMSSDLLRMSKSSNTENNSSENIILEPEQQFTLNSRTGKTGISTFDTQQVIGWKDNQFVFKDDPLSDVLVKLERAYGIKFELEAEEFSGYKITSDIRNASFMTIVKAIKKLTGLEYKTESENNTITKIIYYKK